MTPGTLAELVREAPARGRGGLRFLERDERERFFPWGELVARAERVAAGLVAGGLEAGDRVALVLPTGPEFFDACFGALLAGAVPVPLAPPLRLGSLTEYRRRTAAMLEAAGAACVVTDRRLARLAAASLAGASGTLPLTVEELSADGQRGVGADGTEAVRPDDLALVQFSSGTTVEPKPVALSHRALLAQIELLNAQWRHLPVASGVSWLPLHHDMGLIGCAFTAAALGAELTLIPPAAFVAWPAIWLRAIARHRAAISAAPNFAYALCLERVRDEELAGLDLSSWEVALDGGETVVPAVLRRFGERFSRWGFRPEALAPVYGLAEAALAVTFSRLDRPFTSGRFSREALAQGRAVPEPQGVELASVGTPLPGWVVEPRDEAGRPLPSGRVGRLWIRGPSLMEGYLGRPEATAEVLRDGWLDTGDLGFLADGELYLTGRAKDVVIVRGRNYLPADLEQAAADAPGVGGAIAAVSYLPEGGEREALVLLVEADGAREDGATAVAEACRARLLARADVAPDLVVLLERGALPRTSSGKVRRRAALDRYLAGELAVLATWGGAHG